MQKQFLSNLCRVYKNAYIVGSLGTISSDLKDIPHMRKILVKGAMGCAMAIGLGLSLGTKRKVIVVIGDGSYLMQMGSVATILAAKRPNLKVIVINNNCYNSCGGQGTNFKEVRKSCPFQVFDTI